MKAGILPAHEYYDLTDLEFMSWQNNVKILTESKYVLPDKAHAYKQIAFEYCG